MHQGIVHNYMQRVHPNVLDSTPKALSANADLHKHAVAHRRLRQARISLLKDAFSQAIERGSHRGGQGIPNSTWSTRGYPPHLQPLDDAALNLEE